ncbi:MAG: hypothetical protein WC595_03725 [Candidatus Nanoarchaeia archaeon]
MKEHEYQNAVREIAFYFLSAPAIILIGMASVGLIIDSLTGSQNTFAKLFVYIGGIPSVGAYYYKKWKEFSQSNLSIKQNENLDNALKKLTEVLEKLNEKMK